MEPDSARGLGLRERIPDSRLGHFLYCAWVAGCCAILRGLGDRESSPFVALGWCVLVGLLLASSYWLVASFAPRKVRPWLLSGLGSVWLLGHLGAAYLGAIWGSTPSPSDVWSGVSAIRNGDTPVTFLQVTVPVLGLIALTIASRWLLRAAIFLPPMPSVERGLGRVGRVLLPILTLCLWLQDYLFPPGSVPYRILKVTPGDQPLNPAADETAVEWSQYFVAQTDRLEKVAQTPRLEARTKQSPSLLFVHVESLRSDYFTPELFPKTSVRAKACYKSTAHYSSGNSTSNAIFSVLTGLSAGYTDLVRKRRILPQPLRALRELSYSTHVWFPSDTLLFDRLLADVVGPDVEAHRKQGQGRAELDRGLVLDWIQEAATGGPRFDYLVLDSPHYDYSYPLEFERFAPTARLDFAFNPLTGEGSTQVARVPEETRQGLIHRYKNSLLYTDSLLDQLLSVLSEPGREKPWIVIFGDHGEAFGGPDGGFGHRTQLTDAQTRVPLVICGVDGLPAHASLTSHEDIFPTLFDAMGVSTTRPFMSGTSLLTKGERAPILVRMPVTSVWASASYRAVTPEFSVYFQATDPVRITRVESLDGAVVDRGAQQATLLRAFGAAHLSEP
jgi:Sulfatase